MKHKVGLFDGNGIYRRFHGALKSEGEEDSIERATKAMEETQRKIFNTINELGFTHVCVFFDGEGHTWRHEKYPMYKADKKTGLKKEKPQAMKDCIRMCQDNLDRTGIKTFRHEKLESDDGMANIANKLKNSNDILVVTVAIDKDFDPLFENNVLGYDPFKKFYKNEQWVVEKYGFSGNKLVDYFSLAGDDSDNIPGVVGVKDKKAKQLIDEYGSMENVILCSDNLSDTMNKNVTSARQDLPLYKELINLREIDFPLGFKMSDMRVPNTFAQKKNKKQQQGFRP